MSLDSRESESTAEIAEDKFGDGLENLANSMA